ncbi:MAG: sugar phosphate isomerase/epimerase, partial [Eubacteriales bacterium]|nr:sugar phosphate isomerase/epimerase [Eubacteriales bacterium]
VEWREMQADRLEQTLADLEELRCPIAVVPCLGGRWHIGHGPQEECLEVWQRRIEQMNKLAERLERCGIRMAYHNHDHEFRLNYQGKTVFRWLFDGLAPGVLMELDTGNCLEGGGDPCRELARCASRDVLLHMKPYGPAHGFDVTLGAPDDANDWSAILRALGNRPGRLLVESEAVCLPEMENARLCLEGARSVLKRRSKE